MNHFAALPYADVPDAIERIRDSRGMRETRLALEFIAYTAARGGEVRGMTWAEVDLDAAVWTIPAERMKSRKEQRVPLSIQAQGVLRQAKAAVNQRLKRRPDYDANGLVFPNPSGKPLSDNCLSLRARKDGLGCTPHGFRSSFRDWAAENSGASYEAIELSLAHVAGNAVVRSYFRSDLLEERRGLMEAWANYLDPLPF